MATSSRKRNVTGLAFVRTIGILAATHQGAACDAASVHCAPTITRTYILVSQAKSFELGTFFMGHLV